MEAIPDNLEVYRIALLEKTVTDLSGKTDSIYAIVNNGLRDGVAEMRDNMKWLLRTLLSILITLLIGGTLAGWKGIANGVRIEVLQEQMIELQQDVKRHLLIDMKELEGAQHESDTTDRPGRPTGGDGKPAVGLFQLRDPWRDPADSWAALFGRRPGSALDPWNEAARVERAADYQDGEPGDLRGAQY